MLFILTIMYKFVSFYNILFINNVCGRILATIFTLSCSLCFLFKRSRIFMMTLFYTIADIVKIHLL